MGRQPIEFNLQLVRETRPLDVREDWDDPIFQATSQAGVPSQPNVFYIGAVNVYLINKHYEVAPVLSMTEHEANNAILWISDKLWQSLNAEQKQWVLTSARDVSTQEPKRAFDLERAAAVKLEKMGVKIVADVDKASFQKVADPHLDKLAKELGPHADKIKSLIRAID